MLRTRDLEFDLPESLIATAPVEPRDACRLMVVRRSGGAVPVHARFSDLPRFLRPRDLLVFNRTRVVAARLVGARRGTGGKVRGLFLREQSPGLWLVMLTSGGRLSTGVTIDLLPPCADSPRAPRISLTLESRDADGWLARATDSTSGAPIVEPAARVLEFVGHTPLPPYILGARKARGEADDDPRDRDRYQTVYAEREHADSVAAPTAGLHFTPALLGVLEATGVRTAPVFLGVGLGTFKPIETEYVEQHPIHRERFEVPAGTLGAIDDARRAGGRSVAVGTTTVRALESVPDGLGGEQVGCKNPSQNEDHRGERHRRDACATSSRSHSVRDSKAGDGYRGEASLLISPGHRFRSVDGLITNFHLPRSTLLALVGAMLEGGVPALLGHYREAVSLGYRFFSYGDAMLVID